MRILDMRCPVCKDKDLHRIFTQQGVEVDYCKECGGIWLDKGEIYHFTKTPTHLKHNLQEALKNQRISERLSPKTKTPLVSITLFDILTVEYCPKTGGLWFDKGELEKLPGIEKEPLNITFSHSVRRVLRTSSNFSSTYWNWVCTLSFSLWTFSFGFILKLAF